MKEKNFKIMFFAIIIFLIFFSIYIIIKNNKVKTSEIKSSIKENNISSTIIMGITSFDTIDPIKSKNQDIQYICKLIYEPLINIGQSFELEQGLATEWSKLDEKTYLLRLNENKFWSNGKKFTAKDIEYTIDYIKHHESIYYENIRNIDNIEIINDYTIKIHVLEPEEKFEYLLSFPIICDEQNVGTGNFLIDSIYENKVILQSKISDKKVIINIYDDVSKLYNAFSQKNVDFITTNNINYEKYVGVIGYNKKIICNRNFDFLKFNIEDKKVIQSILYAINKNEIIYKVYNNMYCKAEFPIQYGSYLYCENIKYEFNQNKSKQILKDAGWEYNRRILEKKW